MPIEFSQLTVVIPTLNEQGNIKPLIAEIFRHAPGCKIVVVDDSSDDGTQHAVHAVQSSHPDLSLIARDGPRGLTDSINDGLRAANTPFVAWMDADLSHPPSLLPEMLAQAGEHGCCVASRFLRKNQLSEIGDSFGQAALSLFLNWSIHHVLGLRTTDYTSGYIALKRELLADHPLEGDYGEYFIELLYFLERGGLAVKEISYESPPRTWGESKTGTTIFKLARRGVKYVVVVFGLLTRSTSSPKKRG